MKDPRILVAVWTPRGSGLFVSFWDRQIRANRASMGLFWSRTVLRGLRGILKPIISPPEKTQRPSGDHDNPDESSDGYVVGRAPAADGE